MKRFCRWALCLVLAALMAQGALPATAQGQATKITLPKAQKVLVGRSLTLEPRVTPQGAAPALTWQSANEGVATVDGGLVTGVAPGKAKITVTADGKKATCLVTVSPVPVDGFQVDGAESGGLPVFDQDNNATLLTGHTIALSVRDVAPADAQAQFLIKSAKPGVAPATGDGLITGKKAGKTKITVKAKYGKAALSFPLTVVENHTLVPESKFKRALPAPMPGGGIITVAKRIYLKSGQLMVDMYLYNADTAPLAHTGQTALFMTTKASATDYADYAFIDNVTLTTPKIKSGKFMVRTANLGPVDKALEDRVTQVVLTDAMAYTQNLAAKGATPGLTAQVIRQLR